MKNMNETTVAVAAVIAIVISVIGPLLAWFFSDAQGKGRAAVLAEQARATEAETVRVRAMADARIRELELQQARSDQDRLEIRRLVERLESDKASKELVEGLKAVLAEMRLEMNRRFTGIEKLLQQDRQDP